MAYCTTSVFVACFYKRLRGNFTLMSEQTASLSDGGPKTFSLGLKIMMQKGNSTSLRVGTNGTREFVDLLKVVLTHTDASPR